MRRRARRSAAILAYVRACVTWTLCAVLSWLLVDPPLALAQTAQERAAARAQFDEGVRAAHEDRWSDALAAFERSYALYAHFSTLLNLATTLTRLGRLVEAGESYRRFLREAPSDAATRPAAQEQLAELESRVGRLVVHAPRRDGEDEIWLDGTQLSDAALGIPLPVDPGAHSARITRAGEVVASASIELGEGERRELTLEPAASAPIEVAEPVRAEAQVAVVEAPRVDVTRALEAPRSGDDPAPWIALGVGGGVLIIGGIVLAIVLSQPSLPEGNVPGGHLKVP